MPILDAHAFEFFSRSPEQTRRVGMRLGALLRPGDLVCLQGDLGAGKTTLVQGMAGGWGALDAASSPTFVLVNAYRRADDSAFHHFDAYRVESLGEAEELDLMTCSPGARWWSNGRNGSRRSFRTSGCGSTSTTNPKNTASCASPGAGSVILACWKPCGRRSTG